MSDRLFDSPVFVKDGPYLVREIASIGDALDFLYEWPAHDRDFIYETAWKACCDSHAGVKPVDVAQKRGILEEPEAALPWMKGNNSGGGRVEA